MYAKKFFELFFFIWSFQWFVCGIIERTPFTGNAMVPDFTETSVHVACALYHAIGIAPMTLFSIICIHFAYWIRSFDVRSTAV